MDTAFAIAKAGGVRELSELLKVTRQRVDQMKAGPLPRKHELELMLIKPRWFAEWRRRTMKRTV